MGRRSGLGKGLGALIPAEVKQLDDSQLREIAVNEVRPNPHQPRTHFDEEALDELTASVRELGVLQPILVRPLADDEGYELVAGERRWRAAKRAGLLSIPALVRDVSERASIEQAVVENIQRQDLNPLETAAAYQQLIEEFDLTHEQVAERVGKSRVSVTNALRLFQLPPSVQKLVADGALTAGHARALLGTPDRAFLESLARKAAEGDWSVRAVEDAVRERSEVADKAPSAKAGESASGQRQLRPPGLLELEELLSDHLETRVKVEMGNKKGRVVVEFANLEDLERLYRRMSSS